MHKINMIDATLQVILGEVLVMLMHKSSFVDGGRIINPDTEERVNYGLYIVVTAITHNT